MSEATTETGTAYRCLIVEDDTLVGLGLKAQLEELGHTVVGHASTTGEAELFFREKHPDLVLMDIRLDNADGIDLAQRLLKLRKCPVIIVSAFGESELINRATEAGVFGYLIKPVSSNALDAQIRVAAGRFQQHIQLLAEKEALSHSLEARKVVEKAKGILMKRLNLSENDAHRRLQQESQKRRVGLMELAKKVIESEDLLGGGED